MPKLNSAIEEQMQRDEELFEEAAEQMAEFDDAFDIQYNEEDPSAKQAERKRVYWRDIIEREEQKQQE